MDIGKLIMDNVISIGIATLIVAPLTAYLYTETKKRIGIEKKKLMEQISLITSPAVRKLVEGIIEETEIAMGSVDGKAKFEKAKRDILNQVPDLLDPYVDKLLQGVYDGMVEKL
jgi:hypothetical protein